MEQEHEHVKTDNEEAVEHHASRGDTTEGSHGDLLAQRLARCKTQTAGTELDLSSLGLLELPIEALTEFPSLKKLNVRDNNLTQLPDEIAQQLPHLTLLNATGNKLEVLPGTIGALCCLQRLLLENNCISRLPTSISKLSALEELNVRSNQLEVLDEDLGNHLPKLKTLLLGDNDKLHSIPRSLGSLPSLRTVDLTGNGELEFVPEKIRRLHERNVILHSRAKRRELISRALRVRSIVAQNLSTSAL